ncbi:hypothetical protein KCH_26440 [Kitasatospora cheerisanensis KCTC 2395]|uniref:Core-binding (CB) domain-containing protein n=1 Tax=Kitasatospora cheerisanensis KCTC 2395 TaxID=1348663 RepID=A0A066YWM6_9ACTN|nr:hypothetical protein KCH_26440 [Kitasatospora cheerisanensis KCTC 2395]
MFEEKTYKKCMCKGLLTHRRGPLKGQPVVDETGQQKSGWLGTGCPKLEQRDHGTWWFYIELPPRPDGSRHRVRQGGFRTQKKAAKECKKVWDESQAGLDVGVRETIAEYLDRWASAKNDVAIGTTDKYREHIELHINPFIGHLDRKALRKVHIDRMFAAIADRNTAIEVHRDYVQLLTADCDRKREAWRQGAKQDRAVLRAAWHEARELLAAERKKMRRVTGLATQHRVRATLSSALGDAVLAEEMTKNWAHLVRLPKAKPPKPLLWTPARVARWRATGEIPSKVMVWTPQLLGQFLDTYVDDELFDLWHFMALRGPRRGEACALPWSEVDFDEMEVTISQQVVYVAKKLFATEPKADSERTIKHRLRDGATPRQPPTPARPSSARRPERRGRTPAWSSPRRTARATTPTTSPTGSRSWSRTPGCRPSPCTGCATAPHASPTPAEPKRRTSATSSATPASRSPWTPTPTCSRRPSRPRPKPP